jgi:hypothetical protein
MINSPRTRRFSKPDFRARRNEAGFVNFDPEVDWLLS